MLQGKYFTVTEAAKLTGCSTSYVRRMLRSRQVNAEKMGERAWLIPASQIKKLMENPDKTKGRPRSGKNS